MRLIFFIFLTMLVTAGVPKLALANSASAPVIDNYTQLVYKQYKEALQEVLQLQKAVHIFLGNPNKKQMDSVKRVWISARVPYLQTEAYRF